MPSQREQNPSTSRSPQAAERPASPAPLRNVHEKHAEGASGAMPLLGDGGASLRDELCY